MGNTYYVNIDNVIRAYHIGCYIPSTICKSRCEYHSCLKDGNYHIHLLNVERDTLNAADSSLLIANHGDFLIYNGNKNTFVVNSGVFYNNYIPLDDNFLYARKEDICDAYVYGADAAPKWVNHGMNLYASYWRNNKERTNERRKSISYAMIFDDKNRCVCVSDGEVVIRKFNEEMFVVPSNFFKSRYNEFKLDNKNLDKIFQKQRGEE